MDPMEQIRKENIAKLSKYFTKHMVKMTSEDESGENSKKESIKNMSEIVNQITNLRIRQSVYKVKTNKEIDEELLNWKKEKIDNLNNIQVNVTNICSIIQKILVKPPKNPQNATFDSFQALHIMKQAKSFNSRSQENRNRIGTFLDARVNTLQKIEEKIKRSKQEFVEYSKKCKSTLKALTNIKKTLDFDYVENMNFLKINPKGETQNQNYKKKNKQVVVFYRASKNFPNSRFYRSLVKINITPMEELEYEFSTLEEEKLKDLYDKTFSISLVIKKNDQKKSLASFQLGTLSKKINEIEFKVLNMQLFNYLLQIISFGKIVPFEFKHSKSDLEIDCKHNLSLELAYRRKEEMRDIGKESNNFMVYLVILWLVNNSDYKNIKTNIQEVFGFLGNYLRIKKKINKWKEYFPGFFYVEELNPRNLEILIEAYFHYSKETSFSVFKKISNTPKKIFILIRGSKLYTIHATTGYLNEVSMEQLIEEEFENKFWLHISHQS